MHPESHAFEVRPDVCTMLLRYRTNMHMQTGAEVTDLHANFEAKRNAPVR